MKRITDFPQIVLGLTFAWGGLMGWAAAFGQLDPAAYFIYTAAIAWTFGYDTIYAIQDLEDDALVGIRSTALYFGSRVASAVGTAFTLAILCAGIALILAGSGLIAAAGLAGFAAHLAWQTLRIDRASPERALKLFRSNRDAGLILFAGLCLDAWLR
jgi:4-hydroxybenzoate polyprenyltransferase